MNFQKDLVFRVAEVDGKHHLSWFLTPPFYHVEGKSFRNVYQFPEKLYLGKSSFFCTINKES